MIGIPTTRRQHSTKINVPMIAKTIRRGIETPPICTTKIFWIRVPAVTIFSRFRG